MGAGGVGSCYNMRHSVRKEAAIMIDQALVDRVTQLPAQARLELIELLTRSLREELVPPPTIATEDAVDTVNRLFGILRTGDPPPTDEELKEDYTNHLIQKYS
jgi:hypothetical protein